MLGNHFWPIVGQKIDPKAFREAQQFPHSRNGSFFGFQAVHFEKPRKRVQFRIVGMKVFFLAFRAVRFEKDIKWIQFSQRRNGSRFFLVPKPKTEKYDEFHLGLLVAFMIRFD